MKQKVFVGLSGGVDSSVSAALLKNQGYDVTGVFIKAWYPDFLTCTWKEDRRDAMRVCALLDIPFLTIDLEREYKESVIDYMLREYAAGRTPNPDIVCNKDIKFGAFFDKARQLGADFIATGHYAEVIKTHDVEDRIVYKMLESKDKHKDQTYFLWTLRQDQLAHVLFPVGNMQKSQVRALAKKFNLATATKKDSQGLCFLGKVDLKNFLGHYLKEQEGKVVNEDGKVIGKHSGAYFYTLGERHGFTIFADTSEEKPYYVIAKNIKSNTLTVSHKVSVDGLLMPVKILRISNLNWTQGVAKLEEEIYARMRYRQELVQCRVNKDSEGFFVEFSVPQSIVSPGQSIVFYNDGECLGGAIIDK